MIKLRAMVPPADAILIVPPFAGIDRPALGPHVLQACARAAGFEVRILYANILLAAEIGEISYMSICDAPERLLAGERFFAASAYDGVPPLGRQGISEPSEPRRRSPLITLCSLDLNDFRSLERKAAPWADALADAIADLDVGSVGCSTTFQQTAASVALLRRIKRRRPDVATLIGGPNCEGEMAGGVATLAPEIDFVFSGECEAAFPKFLVDLSSGIRPDGRIVSGAPCQDLDSIPTPDFTEYFEQLSAWLPDRIVTPDDSLWLAYEASRGCWWGQKHHCTFCGLNGLGMGFRSKSAGRVIQELRALVDKHQTRRVYMSDNIMPRSYFRDVLPGLADAVPGLHLYYEQKSNLTLAEVLALQAGGIGVMQPGVEALNGAILRRMDKGVSPRQNIALLRYARAAGLTMIWNMIHDFPGDEVGDYEETLELLPAISHLQPPTGFVPLRIDRFSPYFNTPARYEVRDVRPWAGYASVLPEGTEASKIAYHFDGDYKSAARECPDLMRRIADQIERWWQPWHEDTPPVLDVLTLSEDCFLLRDTRGLPDSQEFTFLSRRQAELVVGGSPHKTDEDYSWALERRLIVELDEALVPLATAEPTLFLTLESEARGRKSNSDFGCEDQASLDHAHAILPVL